MRASLLAFLVVGLLVAADEPKDKAPAKDAAAKKDTAKKDTAKKDAAKNNKNLADDEDKDADKDKNNKDKNTKDKGKKDNAKDENREKPRTTKSDRDRFQGTWRVESLNVMGQKPPANLLKSLQVVVEGTKVALKPGLNVARGPDGRLVFERGKPTGNLYNAKIDPSKKPKQIDLTIDGTTRKGIYEFSNGMLKISYRAQGPRPTKFSGNDQTNFVLTKEK